MASARLASIVEASARIDGRALRYQQRRPQLLAAAAEYVLDNGIGDLSLRPMAQALGVTHATLIRHFKSKEQLIAAVVEHLRLRLLTQLDADEALSAAASTRELLRLLWQRFSEPKEQRQFLLLAEIYGHGVRDPARYGELLRSMVDDFIAPMERRLIDDRLPRARARATATTLLAQIRGLQLDLAATGDRDRVDRAFTLMLDAVLAPALKAKRRAQDVRAPGRTRGA